MQHGGVPGARHPGREPDAGGRPAAAEPGDPAGGAAQSETAEKVSCGRGVRLSEKFHLQDLPGLRRGQR